MYLTKEPLIVTGNTAFNETCKIQIFLHSKNNPFRKIYNLMRFAKYIKSDRRKYSGSKSSEGIRRRAEAEEVCREVRISNRQQFCLSLPLRHPPSSNSFLQGVFFLLNARRPIKIISDETNESGLAARL